MDFSYKGINLSIPDSVYAPAEDSFMLADAVENLSGSILEIGCGSGLVSLICTKNIAAKVIGVDINPEAVACAKQNAKTNKISNVEFFKSDLFSSAKLKGKKFDYTLFNPPYLPTSKDEKLNGKINHAYDGGKDGRVVLDKFLAKFDKYLKPNGSLFLIQSSLNSFEKTKEKLQSIGFSVEIINEQKFFFENLYLIKASRSTKP